MRNIARPYASGVDKRAAFASMDSLDHTLAELGTLLEQRLTVVGMLAESLESGRFALLGNDAEAIARGAEHQAELCRQWALLEEHLRVEAARRQRLLPAAVLANSAEGHPASDSAIHHASQTQSDSARSAQLAAEWEALQARIRYLTRVHTSLLRHMQRSLAIVRRVVESCNATYQPAPAMAGSGAPLRARE